LSHIILTQRATAEHDRLNYIFPVEINNAEEAVEEKLKLQRLNVGFSRAEETIWFVHSKPIVEFKGSIAKVLNHYSNLLDKEEIDPAGTDPSSPMERSILEWLQQTAFYQNHSDSIDVMPQFPIGDYLRQLDPTYQHPAWRADFLVTFVTAKGEARIVIEYDGFEHHFEKGKHVNVGNHERYMLEADVERQLTLESYGYRFLRINRFNLGKYPVSTLSDRLERLVDKLLDENEVASVTGMRNEAEGLASKTLKTCPRCGSNKPMKEFFDDSLKGGEGGYRRNCMSCKFEKSHPAPKPTAPRSRRRWRGYR
jgi:very-short-patch-repair endonuclease